MSKPKSSPDPTNAKKTRLEPEPNESPKISAMVRKIEVKGAESSRKLLCYNFFLCYDIFILFKNLFLMILIKILQVLCYKVFLCYSVFIYFLKLLLCYSSVCVEMIFLCVIILKLCVINYHPITILIEKVSQWLIITTKIK